MKRRSFSLKYFIVFVLVFGCTAGLVLSRYINRPYVLQQPVMGQITSGTGNTSVTLTSYELAAALARHKPDGSIIDQVVKLKSADIRLAEKRIEPTDTVPLIGPAELHCSIFLCDTVCELQDGSERRIRIRTKKHYFHTTGNPDP